MPRFSVPYEQTAAGRRQRARDDAAARKIRLLEERRRMRDAPSERRIALRDSRIRLIQAQQARRDAEAQDRIALRASRVAARQADAAILLARQQGNVFSEAARKQIAAGTYSGGMGPYEAAARLGLPAGDAGGAPAGGGPGGPPLLTANAGGDMPTVTANVLDGDTIANAAVAAGMAPPEFQDLPPDAVPGLTDDDAPIMPRLVLGTPTSTMAAADFFPWSDVTAPVGPASELTPWDAVDDSFAPSAMPGPSLPGDVGMSGFFDTVSDWWAGVTDQNIGPVMTSEGPRDVSTSSPGVVSTAVGYWSQRYEQVRGQLRDALAGFAASGRDLARARALTRAMLAKGADPQVSALDADGSKLETEHNTLAVKVNEARQKLGSVSADRGAGLGQILEGVSATVLVVVFGAVVVTIGLVWAHAKSVSAHVHDVDLLAAGKLTPAELAAVNASTPTLAGTLSGFAGLGIVALAAWWFLRRKAA